MIESLFIKVRRGETVQSFPIWIYGEKELARGSGLFINEQGIPLNHHFLLPADDTTFEFLPGDYVIEIYAECTGKDRSKRLREIHLKLDRDLSDGIRNRHLGLFFDWMPSTQTYCPHLREATRATPYESLSTLLDSVGK